MVAKFKKNGTVKSKGGRPTVVSAKSMNQLDSMLEGNKSHMLEADFDDNCHSLATADLLSSKPHLKKLWKKIKIKVSRRSLGRIKKKLTAKTAFAEVWTEARARACCDKRNAVAFAVAHSIIIPRTHPALIINADGTSVNTGRILGVKKKVIYKGKRDKKKQMKTMDDGKKKGGMGFFIKWYHIQVATGERVEPIFIFQDPAMKKDEIDVYPCGALAASTDMHAKGYIVFCRTRCANVAFYKWVLTDVIVPLIKALRRKYGLLESDPAYLAEDGEDLQLQPLKHEDIIAILKEILLEIGKSCGSTTEIQQPSDAGDGFKSTKTNVRVLNDNDVRGNPVLDQAILAIIKEHEAKTKKPFSSIHRNSMVSGTRKLRQSIMDAMTPSIIVKSFAKTGMYDPDARPPGVNIETILSNCSSDFNVEEGARFWAQLPTLMERMEAQGELFEKDFEELLGLGLVEDGHPDVDSLCVNRRRFVFMLNANFVSRQKVLDVKKQAEAAAKELRKRARIDKKAAEAEAADIVLPKAKKAKK